MATRPLYNGAARVGADNNTVDNALLVRWVLRAQVGVAPATTTETIDNQAFQAEAGTAIAIHWDARKYGGGSAVNTHPNGAWLRIFNDDESQDARTGAVTEFDLNPSGEPMAVEGTVGTVTFTPANSGTFRIQLELEKPKNAPGFGATTTNWRAISDGSFQFGGAAAVTTLRYADKGRLRSGQRINVVAITERGNPAPATFAYTGTEAVRIETTASAAANKTTATETYRIRHRRNGTTTVDIDAASTAQSTTVQRSETTVTDAWPAAATTYDTVVVVTSASALHANNTRQYDALGGQAASGNWAHFVGAGAGLTLVDYTTVARLASHVVDADVTGSDHFQIDDNTFGLTKHDPSFSMLDTDSGFAWVIVRNARGEGVNGLTVTQTLTPVKPGTAVTATGTTSTQDGQAGVSGRLDWTSLKPGGTWDKATDVTAPTTIDADTHLSGGTTAHTLLAINPNIKPYCSLSVAGGVEGDHAHPGDTLTVTLIVENKKTRKRIAADAGSTSCSLARYNTTTERWEYLDADATTWREWTVGGATDVRPELTLTESPVGSRIYKRTISTTSGWGTIDIVEASAHFKVDGTPYDCGAPRELVSATANGHAGYKADPGPFLGLPGKK